MYPTYDNLDATTIVRTTIVDIIRSTLSIYAKYIGCIVYPSPQQERFNVQFNVNESFNKPKNFK